MAVFIAEDITTLFNGYLPPVAIQLNAVRVGVNIAMIFTRVLDQRLGLAIAEEEQEVVSRSCWKKMGSRMTVCVAKEVLKLLKTLDLELKLKYKNNKDNFPSKSLSASVDWR